jgi:taurine--2-oxoglutarate transaminase
MAKLGKFFRENGLFTLLQWGGIMCNPPLTITEAELAEGFDIIDRGLSLVDAAIAEPCAGPKSP